MHLLFPLVFFHKGTVLQRPGGFSEVLPPQPLPPLHPQPQHALSACPLATLHSEDQVAPELPAASVTVPTECRKHHSQHNLPKASPFLSSHI